MRSARRRVAEEPSLRYPSGCRGPNWKEGQEEDQVGGLSWHRGQNQELQGPWLPPPPEGVCCSWGVARLGHLPSVSWEKDARAPARSRRMALGLGGAAGEGVPRCPASTACEPAATLVS